MKEITSLDGCAFKPDDRVVVALGFFDGVHLAHRRLIQTCRERARELDGTALLFTFQNHPSSILNPENETLLLTPCPLKRLMLNQQNVDAVVSVPFDIPLSRTPAQTFIDEVLYGKIHAREIVVGFNYHFGYKRQGNAELLERNTPEKFDRITVIEQQFLDGIPISSSRIRQAVRDGRIDEAARLLGRPFSISGSVIRGDGRGRQIGIPTANIHTRKNQILPRNGVYGVDVRVGGQDADPLPGVMNVGTVPTFTESDRPIIEIHLLDFDGDLYDEYVFADVRHHLRDERRFSGPDELVAQIQQDINTFNALRSV